MADNLPQHVAIIPDGNRRWAAMKGVPNIEGHQAGANRMRNVVEELLKYGVKYMTMWGFSTDNWKRSHEELDTIFRLTEEWIQKEIPWLHENGVCLRHIGRLRELPQGLQKTIEAAEDLTEHNQGMTLALAFNYTGRAEIVATVCRLLAAGYHWNNVDEELFSRFLSTHGMPDVDLVIRTAGELRMSNFMLWQTAYSEYYFCNVFWPDFDAIELEKALKSYQARDRRLGGG